MNIYIQSKSGDFNSTAGADFISSLPAFLDHIRKNGSYAAEYRKKIVEVPFEEILFIKEMEEDD